MKLALLSVAVLLLPLLAAPFEIPSFGISSAIQIQNAAVDAAKKFLIDFYNIYFSQTPTDDLKDLFREFIVGKHPSEIAEDWDGLCPQGEITDLSYYPYVVSMESSLSTSSRFCSGIIISTQHVLTVAQCFDPAPRDIYIRAGSSNIIKNMPGQVVTVERIYKHPCYNYKSKRQADIAVLKLSEKLNFNDRVSAVKLPQLDHMVESRQVGEALAYKVNLLKAPAQILSQKECLKYFVTSGFQFCAWAVNRTQHDCIGYIGSPFLQTVPEENRTVLAGIVSYTGKECTRTPVVYTMVERFLSWIWAVMDQPDDSPIRDYC